MPRAPDPGPRRFLTGAQALGLGAIAGGVRFVAGYPMSPATPILEYCAAHAGEGGIAVELVEDEIAAVNAIQGAAFAGARALCCTAGGGFSLMCEGLSLAGMTETPAVIMVGMRPGPATGLATRTAQADLLFAITAGHGEFPRAVLAPADAGQAFEATQRGLGIAERYQTPAIVLFDQLMADASWTVPALPIVDSRRGMEAGAAAEPYSYRRYAVAKSGVSPRLRPGTAGQLVCVDSDEHGEEGHITESAQVRIEQADKRMRKMEDIAGEMAAPECTDPDADALVLCFGSTRGAVAEAVGRLRARGRSVGMVHICDVWPFPTAAVRGLGTGRRLLTVENNYTGQLARLIRQETLLEVSASVLRFDGRPFRVAEVEAGIEERLA
ncbi:hypothetical protein FJY71_06910 [candidate division WOR-3 bacterium]|nr:hypothetical protein [candidate division WOR-3 bacterium]